jgi:hypothetical protein
MFNDILRGVSKFFTSQRIIILVIFLILAWALFTYSGVKKFNVDHMSNSQTFTSYDNTASTPASVEVAEPPLIEEVENRPTQVASVSEPKKNDYTLHPVANPSDLLPNDKNSDWAALNPNTMNKGDVLMPDLLQAGYHIGLDTIGQSLRNANLQLRSDPVIPKSNVGPWNQSTIEPDLGRTPLEIGVKA